MVGCGAVGGYAAGHMARNGVDVTFIDAWPEHVAKMNADALELRGVTSQESFDVPVRAINVTEVQNEQKNGPFDIAFISTKSYTNMYPVLSVLIDKWIINPVFVIAS